MENTLQRITTGYSELQDRICLAGVDSGNQTVVLWLTHRLLNRLVPHLCQWLERQLGTSPLSELKQEFAQQKAWAELEPQAPVRAEADNPGVLVHSVDLKSTRAGMDLLFKDVGGNVEASLQLAPKPLRQWLSILHAHYQRAGWLAALWPSWVTDAKTPQQTNRAALLH